MVAGIEGVEQDRVDRLGAPQPQCIDPFGPPAYHRRVIGDRDNPVMRPPDASPRAVIFGVHHFDGTAETDLVGTLASFEFPVIAMRQPGFRQFDLPAVGNLLAEQAMRVADAVTIGRYIDGCHRFHETGGQSAKPAIAQRCIRLQFRHRFERHIERVQRVGHVLQQAHIRYRITQQSADQELQRQVVDPLALAVIGLAGGFHPPVDDPVAHCQHGCGQPVMRLGNAPVLADAVNQPLDDFIGQHQHV